MGQFGHIGQKVLVFFIWAVGKSTTGRRLDGFLVRHPTVAPIFLLETCEITFQGIGGVRDLTICQEMERVWQGLEQRAACPDEVTEHLPSVPAFSNPVEGPMTAPTALTSLSLPTGSMPFHIG